MAEEREMSRIVGLDNEFITVECDPASGIVQHVMHRFVVSSVFRQALEAGLELLRAHKATKWLSDDRLNGVLSNEDAEWAARDWRPRAIAAGFRYWAMVLPETVLGKARILRLVEGERSAGLTIQTFGDPALARRWLEQQSR